MTKQADEAERRLVTSAERRLAADAERELAESHKLCGEAMAYTERIRDRLLDSGALAKFFHETYERLVPGVGYHTREASAKAWADVPEANKRLMILTCIAVAHHVLDEPE